MSILEKITQIEFPESQYYKIESPKTQIVIHHTAGGPSPFEAINWWKSNTERVATPFIIAGVPKTNSDKIKFSDGQIFQIFSSKYFAHHLGCKQVHLKVGGSGAKTNLELNQKSIGIEIANYGGLTLKNGQFVTWAGAILPHSQVIEYPMGYRGYKFFHRYTDAQLTNLRELLVYLCDRYNIPKVYQGDRIFDICPDALCGKNGIFTHSSYRPDKSDCHKQPELLQLLTSL